MLTGVTPTGFVAKTVQDLIKDTETDELAQIDPQLDTSPEEPIGQLNAIFMAKVAELWELGGVAYNGMSRDGAEGPQLDNVNGLTGTKRKSAFPSHTLQTNVFSQVGTYPAGSLVANVNGQGNVLFANGDTLTIVLVGGLYTATAANVVLATSASLPLTVPGMKFFCLQNGPTIANASTLNVINGPVTGWVSTNNPLDAELGGLIEQDTPYRLRGDAEISAAGSGNPDAIQADLQNVPGVIQAFVIENTSNVYDANGNPPHSYTAVIWDGLIPAANDSEIAQTLWDDKPTGIFPNGSIVDGIAVDSNNQQHIMPFQRATQLTLYLDYTITMLQGQPFNATVALAIKQAVVQTSQQPQIQIAAGTAAPNPAYLGLQQSVIAEAFKSAVLQAGLGVKDVTLLHLGFSASPGGTTNLSVGNLAIAIADTSRITVNGI